MRQTRRSLLAFAPALPLVLVAPAVAAPLNPDAALLVAAKRCEDLTALGRAFDEVLDRAFKLSISARPGPPEALIVRPDDWHSSFRQNGLTFTSAAVERWRDGIANPSQYLMCDETLDRYLRRGKEVVDAWDAWRAACDASDAAHNMPALHAESERIDQALSAAEEALLSHPAMTLAGLRAKARLAARFLGEPDGSYADHLTRAVLADLLGPDAPDHLRHGGAVAPE